MPELKDLKRKATLTLLEKYAGEIVVAGIVAMLSWNSVTTYQNALALREIGSSIRTYGETILKVSTAITLLDRDVRALDKRTAKVENTRWSSVDQREFKAWIQRELDRKVDK